MPKMADITAEQGAFLLKSATQFEGKKYKKGAGGQSSPTAGFDCSGLVWYVISQAGFKYTYTETSAIPHNLSLRRLTIPPDAVRAGDLMLFSSHVGFYDPDPPTDGKTLYSATSHGVRYEYPKYWGSPLGFYRLQVPA